MKLAKHSTANAGFTLLEFMITTGILIGLFGIIIIPTTSFYRNYQLRAETDLLLSLLRGARNDAMINAGGTDHGVYIDTDTYTIFEGTSYASRNQNQDEIFNRTDTINISGGTEVVFDALTGASSTTTLTLDNDLKTAEININTTGRINWNL